MKPTLFTVALTALASGCATSQEANMDNLRFLASFNTKSSFCFSRVNGIDTANNTMTESGTISTGFNVTGILENGTNTVTTLMAPLGVPDDLNLQENSNCELIISANTPDKEMKLVSLVTSSNDKLQPTGLNTPIYNGNNYVGPVSEGYLTDSFLYEVTRTFEAKGIPEWKWTTATPFSGSDDQIQSLQDKYLDLWLMMKNKDAAAMKKEATISSDEQGQTEGMSGDDFWETTGIEDELASSMSVVNIDWGNFEVKTYNKGRLVRFEDENGESPLRIEDSDFYFVYNPYFSLIDGKWVLTR